MSTSDTIRRVVGSEDWRMVAALLVLIYLTYIALGLLLDFSLRGQINAIANLTFFIAMFSMLALALNLHWGYTGLFNIGIVGFMAIGIYTFAILVKPPLTADPTASVGGFGLPVPIGIVGGIAVATIFGVLVALPALRLRADYLAIVTIAFSEIMRFVFLSGDLQNVTVFGTSTGLGGGRGVIINIDAPIAWLFKVVGLWGPYRGFVSWFGSTLGIINPGGVVDNLVYSVLLLSFVVGIFWLLKRTGESPFGRVLKAIREDEDVARALGKNTDRFKIASFMLGCGLFGLVGVLWFYDQGAIAPNNFRPRLTFFIWIALILGGAGSNTGSVMGGAIFAAVLFQGPLYLKNLVASATDISDAPSTFGQALAPLGSQFDIVPLGLYVLNSIQNFQLVFMGIVLVLLMQNRPDGMLGHRTEEAGAVDLTRPDRDESAVATDGGDGGR